ncbi:MerR family transcriptional regulator [Virgibacillus sp. DJP39]|uniref:MerR family transcriptional regulator n=1 Tax=Virgibacillus sp. DJP39 TaxID=3409790 RepID=UPI003BB701F4
MSVSVGKLAKESKVNKETIRYYERIGLLPAPERSELGYRIYPVETIDHIRFIKRMQKLGFTLKEIDKLLAVVDRRIEKTTDLPRFTTEKIKDVQQKIKDLEIMEKMLNDIKIHCKSPDKSLTDCKIIGTF